MFGTTYNGHGGGYNYGNLFSINTDGGAFTNLHNFNTTNGYQPRGYLTLSETTLYGMAGGGTIGVIFSFNVGSTGIKDADKTVGMNVFPNPTNTIFTISYLSEKATNITLTTTDSSGKIIYTDELKGFSGQYLKTIDLKGQPKGIYFIEMIFGEQKQSRRIVLQ